MVDVKVYRMKIDGWCQKDSRGKGGEVSRQTDASRARDAGQGIHERTGIVVSIDR